MTKDTVTNERLETLIITLESAWDAIRNLQIDVLNGDATPEEAASTVNEIAANVAAAAA